MLLVQRVGMSWTEAGQVRVADYDVIMAAIEQIDEQADRPEPDMSDMHMHGVTRKPIVSTRG